MYLLAVVKSVEDIRDYISRIAELLKNIDVDDKSLAEILPHEVVLLVKHHGIQLRIIRDFQNLIKTFIFISLDYDFIIKSNRTSVLDENILETLGHESWKFLFNPVQLLKIFNEPFRRFAVAQLHSRCPCLFRYLSLPHRTLQFSSLYSLLLSAQSV